MDEDRRAAGDGEDGGECVGEVAQADGDQGRWCVFRRSCEVAELTRSRSERCIGKRSS